MDVSPLEEADSDQDGAIRYATCSACNSKIECTQQKHYPDSGWVFPFDTFGYYGGFDDNLSVLIGNVRSREWIMCHDCVVKFLETFPLLAESIGGNCHPDMSDSAIPCCRYAWKSARDTADKEGFYTAWPDGVWRIHEKKTLD